MADWVKFHREITQGSKRGIPRAIRFVLLELSLACRPLRGSVALPVGMADVDAVHELVGGNRREVAEAVRTYLEDGTIVLEGEERRRTLRIVHWERWNTGIEPAGASTQRSRDHRAKAKVQRGGNGDATPLHARSQQAATHLDQIREEDQIPPVVPPPEPVVAAPAETPPPEHTHGGVEGHEDPMGRALLAAIRSHAALAPLATRAVVDALLGQMLTRPKPQHAVEQAIAEVARDAAMAEATGSPWGVEYAGKQLAAYVSRAKAAGGARATADAAEAFLRRWGANYRQALGQAYVRSDEDPDFAARVVAAADEAARESGGAHDRDAILAHWVHRYLADEGENHYVAKANWPLRHLPRRVSTYGLPRAPKAPHGAPPPAEEPEDQVDFAAAKAGAAAMLAALGGLRTIPTGRA